MCRGGENYRYSSFTQKIRILQRSAPPESADPPFHAQASRGWEAEHTELKRLGKTLEPVT